MSIYAKLAFKYIIKYPQRSTVMIASIALCVCLIISIGSLSESAKTVNIMHLKKEVGAQDVIFREINLAQLAQIKKRPSVKSMATLAYYDDWISPKGSSVNLLAADANILYMEDTVMQAGKYPSQANEIAMEAWVLERLHIAPEPGQELRITLNTSKQTRKFVLTGIIKDRMSEKSYGQMEAFLAFKKENLLDRGVHTNVLLEFKPGVKMKAEIKQLGHELGANEARKDILPNHMLLSALGELDAIDWNLLQTALMLILVGGMVIYSVYNISVLKRIHDYGMMSAIGAGTRQIVAIVMLEITFIYLIGTVLGIGLGTIFVQLFKGTSSSLFVMEASANMKLDIIVISTFAVILSVLAALGAMLAAAIRAVVMAVKMSPMEAISRSSQDEKLKISEKETRLERFLGIPRKIAVKNLRRNKKAVVFTIIAMSIGCTLYMVDSFQTELFARYWNHRMSILSNRNDEFRINVAQGTDMQKGYALEQIAALQKMPQVQEIIAEQVLYARLKIPKQQLNGLYGENYIQYQNKIEPSFDKRVEDVEEKPEDRYAFAFPGDHKDEIVIRNTVIGMAEADLKSLGKILSKKNYNEKLMHEKNWTILYIPEVNPAGNVTADIFDDKEADFQPVLKINTGDKIRLTLPRQGYADSLDNAKLIFQYEKYKNQYVDQEFTVAGIIRDRQDLPETDWFHLGSDAHPYLFISNQAFKEISGIERYRIISVDMKDEASPADYNALKRKMQQLAELIPGTDLGDRVQEQQNEKKRDAQNRLLYTAISAVLIIIGALSIYNNIYYNLISRLREHGIMKAIGLTKKQFAKMVRFEGLLYGAISAVISCSAALLIEALLYYKYAYIYNHPLFVAKGFFIEWKSFSLILVLNLLIAYIATLGPARQVDRIEVTEAIRTIE